MLGVYLFIQARRCFFRKIDRQRRYSDCTYMGDCSIPSNNTTGMTLRTWVWGDERGSSRIILHLGTGSC